MKDKRPIHRHDEFKRWEETIPDRLAITFTAVAFVLGGIAATMIQHANRCANDRRFPGALRPLKPGDKSCP